MSDLTGGCRCSVRLESIASYDSPWWHRGDSVRFGIETLRSRVTEPRRRHVTPCWKDARCVVSGDVSKQPYRGKTSAAAVAPHPPGGQVQEQGPGQRPVITIDWADRLICLRRDTRLNGKWEGLRATLRPTGLCRRTRHKGLASPRRSPPPLKASPSRRSFRQRGSMLSFACPAMSLLPVGVCGAHHRSSIIDTQQRAPPAALTNKPMAAQVVPALCARLHFACAAHAATPGLAFGDQF